MSELKRKMKKIKIAKKLGKKSETYKLPTGLKSKIKMKKVSPAKQRSEGEFATYTMQAEKDAAIKNEEQKRAQLQADMEQMHETQEEVARMEQKGKEQTPGEAMEEEIEDKDVEATEDELEKQYAYGDIMKKKKDDEEEEY